MYESTCHVGMNQRVGMCVSQRANVLPISSFASSLPVCVHM